MNKRTGWRFLAFTALAVTGIGTSAGAQTAVSARTAATPQVTFTKDIAPILQRSCQNCHRPDSIAPMALLTYAQARPYARAMKQRTALAHAPWSRGVMPPWYIEKNIGIQKFKADPSLSDAEIAKFAAWADAGAPEGNPADLPPALALTESNAQKWQLGKPDLIVSSEPVTVPAMASDWTTDIGTVPMGLTEDRYLHSVEYKETSITDLKTIPKGGIGGLFVFHHVSTRVQPPDSDNADSDPEAEGPSRNGGYQLPTHEVGRNGDTFPEDAGPPVKAGSSLTFNAHIHATGTDRTSRFDVGLRLQPKGYTPKYKVGLSGADLLMTEILVNPNESNQRLDAYWIVPENIKLVNYEPHMHAAGVRMCIEAIYGRVIETLNCAGYDHNWVRTYAYDENTAPLIPKGTILHVIGWFDNTPKNANVLDPRNLSRFGNSSVANMFILFKQTISLTPEQYQEELAKRRRYLELTNETPIGCPACYTNPGADQKPNNTADLTPANTPATASR